jgi:hypothetical protein
MNAAIDVSALLSEVERQDQYLSELPKDYNYPLFSGKQAVESQRRSGYKDSARAAREIVDNAIEAGAKNISIVFERAGEGARAKSARRDGVSSVAFIDDGPGMRPNMIRAALTWGGGTHFKRPGRIGRFGFGLPNSSINQTRRLEVYSKTPDAPTWSMGFLDINDGSIPEYGLITIAPPKAGVSLPAFVQAHLDRMGVVLTSGTVVVWVKPDRLTYRTANQLAQHMLEDFGVAYRYLLDEFALVVDSREVTKVDPLFLMKDAMFHRGPDDGGATCSFEKTLAVKYYRDESTGGQHLDLLTTKDALAQARREKGAVVGTMHVRVARFPYGFAIGAERNVQGVTLDDSSKKRFAIRKPRRGMCFVRGGREIDTVNVFPSDRSLGDWPLLQGYAYHWGAELSFDPQLDEAFGIGNDKQTVRPIEDFWRVLHEAEVDAALREEQKWQAEARKKKDEELAQREVETPDDTAATQAASVAAEVVGTLPLPPEEKAKARDEVKRRVKERAAKDSVSEDEAERAIEDEASRKPFAIGFFESDGGVFFKPTFGNGLQKVALINKLHPFFKLFYAPLVAKRDARARGAVDLLLLGLAEAELAAAGHSKTVLQSLREDRLSAFLKVGLQRLDEIQPAPRADDEEHG